MPGNIWDGSMPGISHVEIVKPYTPAQAVWYKRPSNKLEKTRPERSVTASYRIYYRDFLDGLTYFEINSSCGYFGEPEKFKNQIRFPTKVSAHAGLTTVFDGDAFTFDIPDELMSRIYPIVVDANDWTSCFMHRVMGKKFPLTSHALMTNKFRNSCKRKKGKRGQSPF